MCKGLLCGCSLVGTAGSNPARGHGCLFVVNVVCCRVERSLRRADPSPAGVPPGVYVSLSVISCDSNVQ